MPIRKLTGIPKMNVYVINRKNYLLLLITCYLLLVTFPYIQPLTLYNKYHKLPMLLAHHAFILPLSYRHLYLFTAVTRPDHIREQRLPRP